MQFNHFRIPWGNNRFAYTAYLSTNKEDASPFIHAFLGLDSSGTA